MFSNYNVYFVFLCVCVGRPDVVESNPDEPTYTVTSELTLTVTRNDNNALIACAVDHPSIANGDKKTEQPLSVLCKTHIQKPESVFYTAVV